MLLCLLSIDWHWQQDGSPCQTRLLENTMRSYKWLNPRFHTRAVSQPGQTQKSTAVCHLTNGKDKIQFSFYFSTVLTFPTAIYINIYLNQLKSCLKKCAHQTRCSEIHSAHCWENKNPKKAFLIPVGLSGSKKYACTGRVRPDLVWSSPTPAPPCSGGQGHPSATSTCQHRSAGEGLLHDAGDRLKGDASRDLECQSAEQRGTPLFGADETSRSDRCHVCKPAQVQKLQRADARTKASLLHARRVI